MRYEWAMKRLKDGLNFVLPKGRLMKDSLKLLGKLGIVDTIPEGRELVYEGDNFTILLAKSFDVPVYVEHGVDIGIAGSDVVEELESDVFIPLELPFGICRLSVAVLKGSELDVRSMEGFKIATKYPNLTLKFFNSLNVDVEILRLSGSIELAPRIGIADAIVDIVKTGRTLRSNGLVEIHKIMDVSAFLIVNRISQKTKFERINAFVNGVKELIKSGWEC